MTDPNGTGPIIRRDAFLPFFKPDVGEAEITAVSDVLRSGWLTYGPKVREFGQACADYLGAPHAVPVSSCSAGLFLALKALGVGPGDEVILPSLTFIATLTAVRHCGARPVLVDIDPVTLNMDPALVEDAVSDKTRVVFVANPNNPTGTWLGRDALQAFLAAMPEWVLVVVDMDHKQSHHSQYLFHLHFEYHRYKLGLEQHYT